MLNVTRKQQLDDLLDCSRNLLVLAKAGDWGAVRDLQQRFQELAEGLFSSPVTPAESAAVAAVIRKVIQVNGQVSELGLLAQRACLDELGLHRQRRQAVREYSANQSPG